MNRATAAGGTARCRFPFTDRSPFADRSLAIAWFVQCLLMLVGCASTPDSADSTRASAAAMTNTTPNIHDAGRVMAGTPIRHTFQLLNGTDRRIRLISEDDIRMSCGCAAADVRSHALEPGEATFVDVQLNTSAKRGDVTEAVATTWTADDQSQEEFTFQIRAHIQTALTLTPPEVIFSKEDIAKANTKRIECTSELDLDWSRAEIVPLVDGLLVERRPLQSHGLTFDLSFHPSSDRLRESRQGFVRVAVPCRDSAKESTQTISESLAIHWSSPGSTQISPAVVAFHAIPDSNDWQGWFIVTGDKLKQAKRAESIQRIESSAAQVEYRERRLAPSAVRVEATLSMHQNTGAERPRWIDIVLTSGERKRLRILCSESPLSRSAKP